MQAKYGQDINRDSAYEMLARKLEAGAARAQEEADAKEQAKEQAAQDKADAAQQRSAPRTSTRTTTRTSSRPAPRSGVERVLGSATFWNQVIRVGGQVVRTMWGTAKR
jgi:protein subunit release factor B